MSKHNPIQLDIPHPCTQNWDEMTSCGTGRFCSHCQKTVIDFTAWTDTALYNFFSKNTEPVCGRMLAAQIRRPINIPPQPHSRLYRLAIALGLTLIFSESPQTFAQTPLKAEQSLVLSKTRPALNGQGELRGRVLDNKKEPMINATIQVFSLGLQKGGCVTDYDGNYSIISLEPGNYTVLTIYAGYDSLTKNITIVPNEITKLDVILNRNATTNDNYFFVGYVNPLVNQEKVNSAQTKKVKKRKNKSMPH